MQRHTFTYYETKFNSRSRHSDLSPARIRNFTFNFNNRNFLPSENSLWNFLTQRLVVAILKLANLKHSTKQDRIGFKHVQQILRLSIISFKPRAAPLYRAAPTFAFNFVFESSFAASNARTSAIRVVV